VVRRGEVTHVAKKRMFRRRRSGEKHGKGGRYLEALSRLGNVKGHFGKVGGVTLVEGGASLKEDREETCWWEKILWRHGTATSAQMALKGGKSAKRPVIHWAVRSGGCTQWNFQVAPG